MKLILKSLGFLLLLLCLIIVIIALIPDSQYKNLAEKSFNKFTDRTLTIGNLTTTRNLNPSIEFSDVQISNPEWADKAEMIKAGKFLASLNLIELVKGNLFIDMSSDALNIDFLRNADGLANWQFKSDDTSQSKKQEDPSLESLTRFVLDHLNMTDFKVAFTDNLSDAHHELQITDMKVIESDDRNAQDISLEGSFDKLPLSLTGSTGTPREFGLSKKLPLDLKAQLDNLALSLKGDIDASSQAFDINTEIQVSSPDLSIVSQFTDLKLPANWKDLRGAAQLKSQANQFSLDDIKVTMEGGLKLDISGAVADLVKLQGIDATVNATLNSVNELSSFSAAKLPDIGPFDLTGKLHSDNDLLSFSDAELSYKGEYGTANIAGKIGDLIKIDQANLNADIALANLNIVKLFTDVELPEVGEIKLTGQLTSNAPADLSANDLKLDYDHQGLKLSSSGSINSIIKNGGELNLDINANVATLSALNVLARTELPALGPVDLSSTLSGTFTGLKVNGIVAEINDKDLSGSIKGDLGAIDNFDAINFTADLTSTSVTDLLAKLDIQSPVKTAAKFSAAVGKNNNDLNISDIMLDMDGNTISGDMKLENILAESMRRKLSGTLKLLKFDLAEVLNDTSSSEEESAEKSGFALPDSPLPFNHIRDNDIDLSLEIASFESPFVSLSDASIKLVSEQGNLKLGPIDTKVNGGDTHIEVTIDAANTPAAVSINSEISGFSIKQAGTFEGSELLENEGSANAKLDFTGNGESIAAILGSSSGSGEILIDNLTLKNDTIKFVSGDLVTEAVAALNPLDKEKNTTTINCSAAKFDLKDGLFNTVKGFIADSEAFTITGESKINFKDQAIDIKVNTNPKEGLGLGLGDLARAIQIKGTIESPKVALNPEGIAELGATIGAALATGGVSLLAQGQIEKLKAKSEVCSSVLK